MQASEWAFAFEKRPLARWLRAIVLAISLSLVTVAATNQFNSREAILEKTEIDAVMLSNSLAQHAIDTFEITDVLLTTLADRLRTSSGRSLDDIYLLDTALEGQVRSVPRIRSLAAFDRTGKQFASSQPQVPDWFDLADDEAFAFHRSNFGDTIRIGRPTKSPSTDDWLLTVSKRWDDAGGQFGGMVLATIRVQYFSDFYRDFNVAGEAGISLLDSKGVLLSRYPLLEKKLGKDLSKSAWFPQTIGKDSGTLRFTSSLDGVARVHGYKRVQQIPLLMFVGVSEASVLAGWLPGCIIMMTGACVFAIAFGVLGWRFAAQIDARQVSALQWSKLAMTDALTGARNRRAFDEIARQQWNLSQARRRPLSLIFIDVDHFKAFNDTYGHPAGDNCLKEIAMALGTSIYKPDDCVARYGGEEFAVLLSDIGLAGAMVLAERIRQSVLMLGIPHSASKTLPLISISLGVATETFEEGHQARTIDTLVERADRALYQAKFEGRNRVKVDAPNVAPAAPLKQAN